MMRLWLDADNFEQAIKEKSLISVSFRLLPTHGIWRVFNWVFFHPSMGKAEVRLGFGGTATGLEGDAHDILMEYLDGKISAGPSPKDVAAKVMKGFRIAEAERERVNSGALELF